MVGNPVFGASVQTFINLGINPNTTCIEISLLTDPAKFALGSYIKGGEGQGFGYDPTTLGAYNGATTGIGNANGRDFYWAQDRAPTPTINGIAGSGPSQGITWHFGGQANQVAVLLRLPWLLAGRGAGKYRVLSNDPNAADGGWTEASLVNVSGAGWSAD